jgi:hypothetical protein
MIWLEFKNHRPLRHLFYSWKSLLHLIIIFLIKSLAPTLQPLEKFEKMRFEKLWFCFGRFQKVRNENENQDGMQYGNQYGMKTKFKMECNMEINMEWKRKSRWNAIWSPSVDKVISYCDKVTETIWKWKTIQ